MLPELFKIDSVSFYKFWYQILSNIYILGIVYWGSIFWYNKRHAFTRKNTNISLLKQTKILIFIIFTFTHRYFENFDLNIIQDRNILINELNIFNLTTIWMKKILINWKTLFYCHDPCEGSRRYVVSKWTIWDKKQRNVYLKIPNFRTVVNNCKCQHKYKDKHINKYMKCE